MGVDRHIKKQRDDNLRFVVVDPLRRHRMPSRCRRHRILDAERLWQNTMLRELLGKTQITPTKCNVKERACGVETKGFLVVEKLGAAMIRGLG